jgi:hypothetical protein
MPIPIARSWCICTAAEQRGLPSLSRGRWHIEQYFIRGKDDLGIDR